MCKKIKNKRVIITIVLMFVLSVMLPVLAIQITGKVGSGAEGGQVKVDGVNGGAVIGSNGDYSLDIVGSPTSFTMSIEDEDGNAKSIGSVDLSVGKGEIRDGKATISDYGSATSITVNVALGGNTTNNSNPPPSLGDSGGSIGGDTGVGSVVSGSEDTSTSTSTETSEEKVTIDINGMTFSGTVLGDGTVSVALGEADVEKYANNSSVFELTFKGVLSINVGVPVAILRSQALKVTTDMGTVLISNDILKQLGSLFGGTVTVSIKKGSFIVELLDNSGKPFAYNNAAYPLTLTLPYTPGKDENVNAIVGAKVNKGSVIKVYNSVYEAGFVTFDTPQTGTYDVIYNAKGYADAENSWAIDYINFVTARNISEGVDANNYGVNAKLSRALFVYELAKADGSDINAFATSMFSDVKTGAWYTKAVGWAAKLGVTNGKTATTFEPNALVTREEMATMLYRYIQKEGYKIPVTADATLFADADQISDWAAEAVQVIKNLGIIQGREGNVFDPKATATRAEYAKILAEFVKKFK